MQTAKLDILVLQFYEEKDSGKGQLVEKFIRACESRGMKYFLGLSPSGSPFEPTAALLQQLQTTDSDLAKKVNQYIKRPELFAGWYLSMEIHSSYPAPRDDGPPFLSRICDDYLVPLTKQLKELTPNAKIMVCPFANTKYGISWNAPRPLDEDGKILKEALMEILAKADIDIVAPQDGRGADKASPETVTEFYKSMREAVPADGKVELWATVETMVSRNASEYASSQEAELETLLRANNGQLSQLLG